MKYKSILIALPIALSLAGCGFGGSSKAPAPVSTNSATYGQGRMQRADLSGEVVSVAAGNITVKVLQMPSFQGPGRRQRPTDGAQDQRPSEMPTPAYTGETKTITVPAGMVIKSFSRGDNNEGPVEKDIKPEELKAGDRVQVWYSDKTTETVSQIRIMGGQK